MSLQALITERVDAAFRALEIESPSLVQPAGRPEFGDYQINGVMGAAKARRTNPRALAEQLLAQLDLGDIASCLEIAGPGFINIHLAPEFLATRLEAARQDARLGVPKQDAKRVVIDYSGPNLAKEMHVGHLRSTIIGDALVQVLEFLGHDVIRQNHVGDWGTQFGMLVAYLIESGGTDNPDLVLSDLEGFYRAAKLRFDEDADFAERARENVVKLQAGDAQVRALWQQFIDLSLRHCEDVYQRLGVSLTREHVRGESSYNDDLANVVADLDKLGMLSESQGAQCVFLPEFTGKDKEPLPCIVQKSDGGYLYATSDLAAIRYRVRQLNADRILYFVDARQALHLQQVFAISYQAGFAPKSCDMEHMAFGTMMGEDGKPFKTRTGGTVKLIELLDEAEQRAFELVTRKNPDLDEASRKNIARSVGIGAVKYADLSKNRTSDYIFNWATMLSFEGNTAPYLQYAFARIQSIFRKLEADQRPGTIIITEPAERALAVHLAQFAEQLNAVAREGYPNLLCQYLYQLAGHFMRFYEACPILKAEADVLASRLALADLTAKTLKQGLALLGIEVLESM